MMGSFMLHIHTFTQQQSATQVDNWAATWDEMVDNYKKVDAEPYC
jgi:hypothetical protein